MAKKHGHHGGAWKIAYADFVTAMMALFLVLWLTSQDEKIKEAVQRSFTNPFSSITKESAGIISQKEVAPTSRNRSGNFDSSSAIELAMLRRLNEDLLKALQKEEDSEEMPPMRLDMTPEGLRISIFDRSRKPIFKPQSAEFTKYGDWVMSTLAWQVSLYAAFNVELEGHMSLNEVRGAEPEKRRRGDAEQGRKGAGVKGAKGEGENSLSPPLPFSPALPAANPDYGVWEISADRAGAARRKLIQHGVSTGQIRKVAGFGDTVPMPETNPEDELNRRITVMLKIRSGQGKDA